MKMVVCNMKKEIADLEKLIFDRFGKHVYVKFGEVMGLGEWFYIERKFYGVLRFGSTFNSAKWFIENIDENIISWE